MFSQSLTDAQFSFELKLSMYHAKSNRKIVSFVKRTFFSHFSALNAEQNYEDDDDKKENGGKNVRLICAKPVTNI